MPPHVQAVAQGTPSPTNAYAAAITAAAAAAGKVWGGTRGGSPHITSHDGTRRHAAARALSAAAAAAAAAAGVQQQREASHHRPAPNLASKHITIAATSSPAAPLRARQREAASCTPLVSAHAREHCSRRRGAGWRQPWQRAPNEGAKTGLGLDGGRVARLQNRRPWRDSVRPGVRPPCPCARAPIR